MNTHRPLLLACGLAATLTARAELVFWLPLDDGAGAVATDASGHTGGFTSGPGNTWLATGAFGGSLQLGAADTLLARAGGVSSSTLSHVNSRTANKVSIAFWAKPNVESQGSSLFYANDNAGGQGNRIFGLHLEWTDGSIYWDHSWQDGTPQRLSGTGGTVADTLHHYVLTYNGDTGLMQIHKDNVVLHSATQATQTTGGWDAIRNWEIGAFSFDSYYGGGQVDDYAVFDHVLTAGEINTIYSYGVGVWLRGPPPSVVDAGGGVGTTPGGDTLYFSIGQGHPVGAFVSTPGQFLSGFQNMYIQHPARDTDGDLVIDENDADDDNDGLGDGVELAGSSFNPVTASNPLAADSDNDGASDRSESVAGTNPLDAAMRLRIVSVDKAPGSNQATLTVQGRAGVPLKLQAAGSVTALADVGDVTLSGGTAPWFFTTTSVPEIHGAEAHRVYRLRVGP